MAKKIDILIIYETRVRELENICLLKYELERRGYRVAVLDTWNSVSQEKRVPRYKARVVIAPSMYHNGIFDFIKSIAGKVEKLVNLQWEQIGTVGDEESDECRFVLGGLANQCMNICWGDMTVNRLKERSGIDSEHIRKTGHIALDFCRKEMRDYYFSREDLLKKYNLNQEKQINLFISSFSYINLPADLLEQSQVSEKREFIKTSVDSFNGILNWFSKILDKYENQIIIYRPHPAEFSNLRLADFEIRYSGRFCVIGELSVKQWVLVSDRVYTWYSTSAAEAYVYGNPCAILRPVKIPESLELQLYKGAKFIDTFKDFEKTFTSSFDTAIDEKTFQWCYHISDKPAYVQVVDAIEDVFREDKYKICDVRKKPTISHINKVKSLISNILIWVARRMPKKTVLLRRFRREKMFDAYTLERMKNNYASVEDIAAIQKKIQAVVEKNKFLIR